MPLPYAGPLELPFSTGANVQDATTYKGNIDADMAVFARTGGMFAPHANTTPDMRVYVGPGSVFDGTTLTEVGAFTTANINGFGTGTITGSTDGISGTMLVTGKNIPNGTTATISGTTVTFSNAPTATTSGVVLKFSQRTSVITAPVTHPRIDRIVVDSATGVVSVITGTEAASPTPPAITSGKLPVAQVLLQTSTTAITNNMITDERTIGGSSGLSDGSVTTAKIASSALSQILSGNVIINPTFQINQRLASSNADDTYGHDRWYALTQTAAIAVSTLTDQENTTPYMGRLTQSQVTAQRMGYAQIIEGKNCKHLRGQTVNLSMRYRCSSSQAIRFAILEWTGTEDSVTSDVVNSWTSGTYTAGNFFLASNLTIRSVSAATPSAATLTDFTVSATLGSSFNNLIIFVWTEGTAAQNVTLDLGKVKLEIGSSATPFIPRSFAEEMELCRRYMWKSYNGSVAPGTNVGTDSAGGIQQRLNGITSAVHAMRDYVPFPAEMFSTPTITFYSTAGTSGNVTDRNTSSDSSSGLAAYPGQNGFSWGATSTSTSGTWFEFQATAIAEL